MTTQREGLLDKIRALLSKTVENGCTEEEALAALAKARAMMDVHEVSDDELNLTKEEKAILRKESPGTEDPHNIKFYLATSIAKFCGCKTWRNHGGGIVFCGLRADADFATWLLDALAAFVKAETVNHLMHTLAEGRERHRVIKGFVLGCTDRISLRLNELCEQPASQATTSNATALVVTKQAAVDAKMKELGIKIRTVGASWTGRDEGAYSAGNAAGSRASFGRPMSGRAATLRLTKS
jgi:uncharacterized protein DUF2786